MRAQEAIETVADLKGEKINREWTAFAEDSGTLGIPRSEMPQIKAEHRGALVQFLKARGIESEEDEVKPGDLKPTQKEYSPGRVEKAREHIGGDRAILVSSDNYVCVDTETEILTRRGWLAWDKVVVGDTALTLNHRTGLSEWHPVKALNILPEQSRRMVLMEGSSHSSLTTPDHRWPTLYLRGRKHDAPGKLANAVRRWRTSESLTVWDALILGAECATLPNVAVHSDAVVELVAWTWTEGTIRPSGRHIHIFQSVTANPSKCEHIRAALRTLFGNPVKSLKEAIVRKSLGCRRGWSYSDRPAWTESLNGKMAVFRLTASASEMILANLDSDKVVSPAFIGSLTRDQLQLFVNRSIDADGWNGSSAPRRGRTRIFVQKLDARVRMFQMACALLGWRSTASRSGECYHATVSHPESARTIRPLRRARRGEKEFKVETVDYTGRVWCPTITNSSWLARRRGTVYFTGNCDGHHQWMAKLQDEPGDGMRVIRFGAKIRDVLKEMEEFPSVENAGGATKVKESVELRKQFAYKAPQSKLQYDGVDFQRLSIVSDGAKVGEMEVQVGRSTITVRNSLIYDQTNTGRGIGQAAYLALARMFPGKTVRSSDGFSDQAGHMWSSLERKGKAHRAPEGHYAIRESNAPPTGWGSVDTGTGFEEWGVLAEPNTPGSRQFGGEKPDKSDPDILRGEFGTLRAVQREGGKIIGGVVIGRRDRSPWKLMLMQVRPEHQRRGVARSLLAKLSARVGKIQDAAEYTSDGRHFSDANRGFFRESAARSVIEGMVREALTIRVPPFAQAAFFQDHGADEEFWAFKTAPKAAPGDRIEFKFGSKVVATATVSRVEEPGQSECGHSGRFKDRWKIHWKDATFRRLSESDEYRGEHTAPDPESGAPMHDLAKTFPKDVYDTLSHYRSGYDSFDNEVYATLRRVRGHPGGQVRVYRAVPPDVTAGISAGDWVTPARGYAVDHGKSNLNGKFRVRSKVVHPRDLFTDGDLLEWGYFPQPYDAEVEKRYRDERRAKSAARVVESTEFSSWFAGSKVVDAAGKPLRVYHGTNQEFDQFDRGRGGEATKADSAREGIFFTSCPNVASEYADNAARRVVAGISHFERERDRLRAEYERLDKVATKSQRPQDFEAADRALEAWEKWETDAIQDDDQGQNVFPAYLRMLNPLVIDASEVPTVRDVSTMIRRAKRSGHDGLIIRNSNDNPGDCRLVSDHYVAFSPSQVRSAIGAIGEAEDIPLVGQISRGGDVQFVRSNGEHEQLGMVGGKPWRYRRGKVYWHEEPSDLEKDEVRAALEKRGERVVSQVNLHDFIGDTGAYSDMWDEAHGYDFQKR